MKRAVVQIQHLRFLAACLVLVGHAIHEAGVRLGAQAMVALENQPFDWGIGVDVFFVISGFVMFYSSGERFGAPGAPRQFITHRLRRVVPLYWIFTSLMALAIILAKSRIIHHQIGWAGLSASYFFIPLARPDGDMRPLLAVGWTLNYEMFFYVAFAFCMVLRVRAGLMALFGFFMLASAAHTFLGSRSAAGFWTDPIILEFLAGICVCMLYEQGGRIPRWAFTLGLIMALTLALVMTAEHINIRALKLGVPAVILVAIVVLSAKALLPESASSLVALGGDASYALYLSHPFALNLASLIWERTGLTSPIAFVIFACVAAISLSVLVHLFVEKPLLRWLRKRDLTPVSHPAITRIRG